MISWLFWCWLLPAGEGNLVYLHLIRWGRRFWLKLLEEKKGSTSLRAGYV